MDGCLVVMKLRSEASEGRVELTSRRLSSESGSLGVM